MLEGGAPHDPLRLLPLLADRATEALHERDQAREGAHREQRQRGGEQDRADSGTRRRGDERVEPVEGWAVELVVRRERPAGDRERADRQAGPPHDPPRADRPCAVGQPEREQRGEDAVGHDPHPRPDPQRQLACGERAGVHHERVPGPVEAERGEREGQPHGEQHPADDEPGTAGCHDPAGDTEHGTGQTGGGRRHVVGKTERDRPRGESDGEGTRHDCKRGGARDDDVRLGGRDGRQGRHASLGHLRHGRHRAQHPGRCHGTGRPDLPGTSRRPRGRSSRTRGDAASADDGTPGPRACP